MADATPTLSLAVGDRVVYPNQGVCRVSAVEVKEVAGQKLTFVTMKREEDGAVVMVPKSKVEAIGVRKVSSPDDVGQIFDFLRSDSDKANLDWKQRARTNSDRMAQGGLLGLAEVVKGLQVLSELRPLPAKERGLYDNARHLLVTEIAISLGIADCDAEDAVDLVLFPVGRERPKRTAAEFADRGEGEDDGLDLGDDLMGLDGGDLLPPDDEAESSEDEEASEEEGSEEEGEKAPKGKKAKKAELSDDDETAPMGTALVPQEALPPKRKRGRPPKAKPAADAPVAMASGLPPLTPPLPAAPRKRGRPPKVKTDAPAGEGPEAAKKKKK